MDALNSLRHALTPTFPDHYDAWEGFLLVVVLTAFKWFRATQMKRRAVYIDRFGWSIIIFDYVFAVVFGVSVLFQLYPGTNVSPWIARLLLGVMAAVTLWQFWEVYRASDERVEAATHGPREDSDEGDPSRYDRAERRRYVRRSIDRENEATAAQMRDVLERYRGKFGELT